MSRQHSIFRLICKAAVTAGAIYAVNEFVDRYATGKKLLTYHAGNIFTWRGIKVYYNCIGSGSPVILIHNLHPAASSYEWIQIQEKLAETHTVYTIDLPGLGRSDKHQQPYTNFYYVEFLREFMKEMSISNAALVASNDSASIAVMTSIYDASLFNRLILISPPAVEAFASSPTAVSKFKKSVLELPLIGTMIYNILYARTQIDFAFTEQYLYNPFHENTELVDTCYESAHLGHGKGRYFAASLIGGYLNINIEHALSRLSIPTLILEGSNTEHSDQIISEWTDRNDSISSVKIPHTKALPHLEEPDLVIEKINEFIG